MGFLASGILYLGIYKAANIQKRSSQRPYLGLQNKAQKGNIGVTMKKQLEEKMLYDIMELVRIPSVYSEGSFPKISFGRAVAQCLEKTLEIGKKLGFQVKNYDGYVGEMDMGHTLLL